MSLAIVALAILLDELEIAGMGGGAAFLVADRWTDEPPAK